MKVRETPLRDVLRLVVWFPLRWIISFLSVRHGIHVLTLMGDMHYHFARAKRKSLKERLFKLGLLDVQPDCVVRSYFRNHYVDQLFILIFPKMTVADIEALVELEGLGHLEKYRTLKKGVILVHGHFGPAHLPLVALALLGFPMKQIGNPSSAGLSWVGRNIAYRMRMRYEGLMPAKIIEVRKFLRPVFHALKNNEVVMTTGDGSGTEDEFGEHYEYIFLNKKTRMPLGPALLAEKTGAALLPLYVTPGRRKMFRITIGERISLPADRQDGVIQSMLVFWNEYQDYVRRYPGYMHFLDRL